MHVPAFSEPGPFGEARTTDASGSLTRALQVVAGGRELDIDFDDLHAALGLSLLVCAVRSEPNLARWPAYARDAFLLEAGRLFGLTLRPLHPPDAALGLSGAPEYRQHFDASYRPLVLRALEHEQPVLAWQGWAGEHVMSWGVIRRPCDEGIGFEGVLVTDDSAPKGAPGTASVLATTDAVMRTPPLQLYVVETTSLARPEPTALIDLALAQAGETLRNEMGRRFGVVTGPAAYDVWIDRLEATSTNGAPSDPLKAKLGETSSPVSDAISAHQRLAASVSAGHESALRFFHRHIDKATSVQSRVIEALAPSCREAITALGHTAEATSAATFPPTLRATSAGCAHLVRAKKAAEEMCATLARCG